MNMEESGQPFIGPRASAIPPRMGVNPGDVARIRGSQGR